MESKIAIKNVNKKFNKLNVLNNISFSVNRGEVVCIIGPSGSGKSTLIRCINNLENVDSGQIIIDGVDIVTADKKSKRKILGQTSMVFQNFNLFYNMNILKNLTFAPIVNGVMNKREAEKKAMILLEKVGLKEKIHNYPNQLSGGQKQRIAIARSLMVNPKIILFDEPTSALDPEMTVEIQNIINELAKTDITMVVVTHEMNFVKRIADKVVFMDSGTILEVNETEKFFSDLSLERKVSFLESGEK